MTQPAALRPAGPQAHAGPEALPSPRALARARRTVTAVFFAFATGLGLWAGAIPALLGQSGLDVTGLGTALALHSAAYIGAMAAAGRLARRVPPRRLMAWALGANLPVYALLFVAATPAQLTAALVAVGLCAGLLDLAMNAEGTQVERQLGRPVLLSMHAAASAGFALSALAGSQLASHLGPWACAVVVAAVHLPVALALRRLGRAAPAAADPASASASATAPTLAAGLATPHPAPHRGWPAPQGSGTGHGVAQQGVLRLGVVLGVVIAAEVTAQMWSARYLVQQSLQDGPAVAATVAAWAGAGAALFAGFQALVRLAGDRLRRRISDRHMVLASLALGSAGLALVAASGSLAGSLLGFALVGLGTACAVPCCFAMITLGAGDRGAAALGTASLVAGAIRVPAPLLLGVLTAHWSDRVGFAAVAAAVLLALGLMLRPRAGAAR